jgi:hypothetical protein
MSSFTLSSDAPADPEASWRRWIIAFCGTFLGLGGLLFILMLLIDPYDSARFPTLGIVGIDDHNPRMATVSRARDARFDSAVIGNSTGQLINPHRIGPRIGLSFTQLTVPGTGPREQLAIMSWFASHHQTPGAFVLVADDAWCTSDPDLPVQHPFPFWLYGGNLDYLTHVMNGKSLDRAIWRVQLALGMRQPVDPVGYSDYTAVRNFGFQAHAPEPTGDLATAEFPLKFPWALRLKKFVSSLPRSVSIVIVVPPVPAPLLPPPGSRAAEAIKACQTMLENSVTGRRVGGLLDFRVDNATTRDPGNFSDSMHYNDLLARQIEERIVATLRPAARTAEGR